MAIPVDPEVPNTTSGGPHVVTSEERGVSQGRIVLRRFLSHKPAVISMILFVLIVGFAISASGAFGIPGWWKWNFSQLTPIVDRGRPTLELFPFSLGEHPFGQNTPGKDYFAMVMRGIVNSSYIMFILGLTAAFIGVVIGAIAGYYRGWVDAVLMRFTDVVIVIPVIVVGAVVGIAVGGLGPVLLAVFLGFVAWTGIARLVRAEFLSLREREFVEAARVAGASDLRIIFKHILPNAMGVVIVSTTLLLSAAIILETSLSFLGYGVKSPEVSLGLLISDNQAAFQTRPWLFWWPASFIVILSLLVNFIGDGLRDAFDPRQKRVVFRKVKELPEDAVVEDAAGPVPVGGTPGAAEGRA
jgi:peptide/nickel transport system permease protein